MNSRWKIFGSIIPSVRLIVFSPTLTPHITTVSILSKILPHSELSTTRTHNLRMNKILAISSCKNAEVVLNFYTVNMKNFRGHASYSFYLTRQQTKSFPMRLILLPKLQEISI